MITKLLVCLAPLGVLSLCIALACFIGYALLLMTGDILPIERIVNKGTQLLLVLSIFPLMNLLNLQGGDIGLPGKAVFLRELWQGILIGIAILGPIILLLYYLDIREFNYHKIWTVKKIIGTLLVSLVTAAIISLLEEPVFRGILITAMQRKMGVVAGIMISAMYYAGLHFLKTDLDVPYVDLRWFSAFELVIDAFGNLFNSQNLPAFSALFMVGIFLGTARLHAGMSLGFCVGCHTGWVFLIKLTKSMSTVNVDAASFFLVSHYDGVIGPLVTGWLVLVVAGYYGYNKRTTVGKRRQ